MTEEVNHPDHYGGGDNPHEVIKVLRAWNLELAKGFCWGNMIKYTARAEQKGGLQDYKKADWYAAELISIEAELAGRPKKGPSEIPIVLPTSGAYRLDIDWEARTHKVVYLGAFGASGGSSAPGGGNSASGGKSTFYATTGGGGATGATPGRHHDHSLVTESCRPNCPGWI